MKDFVRCRRWDRLVHSFAAFEHTDSLIHAFTFFFFSKKHISCFKILGAKKYPLTGAPLYRKAISECFFLTGSVRSALLARGRRFLRSLWLTSPSCRVWPSAVRSRFLCGPSVRREMCCAVWGSPPTTQLWALNRVPILHPLSQNRAISFHFSWKGELRKSYFPTSGPK